MRGLILICAFLSSCTVVAETPDDTTRPVMRPTQAEASAGGNGGLLTSLRPLMSSRGERADARLDRKGAVCGDAGIQGVAIGSVSNKAQGCGVEDAVRVKSISGVTLSQQSVMDCVTARTLKSWVDKGLKPAIGNQGGGAVSLRVAAHYVCRTRNNQKGTKISEHGRGRAIDIAAVGLRDGSEISVLDHWGKGTKGKILQRMHRSACGPFGTVLGPNSDRYHRNHFHFDTARYRSGAYCR